MLLPSDVARLVLGYLQEEGLSATSRAFIHESSNLKEYAEHSTEDGSIPACVFSIFGKGLTTILNEYVASRTKESNHQVPAMMSSLWKKLDFTLNQIKSLQHSPALSACQRIRSRELANIARQRTLANSSTGVTVSETISIVSPAQTSHGIVTHSTPVSFSGPVRLMTSTTPNLLSHEGSRLLSTARESPVQVTEHRLNPAPLSPGRRKWKRSAVSGGSSSSKPAATNGTSPEEETEELADENFPQIVIQNARDKILGDRSLQEKLAENINKILASEPTPQTSKACTNIVEPDQSIDEILGLQGEIHMSDDAIHDILEQTESDPAFQALFDLFEYNKSKTADGEPADGDISSSPDECDLSGPAVSSVLKPCQNVESGIVQKEASEPASMKSPAAERKTRKSAPVLKKIITSNRSSRVDTCSAKLLVVQEGSSSSKRNVKNPDSNTNAPMDIDEPQASAAPTSANMSPANTSSSSIASSLITLTSMVSDMSNLTKPHENKATPGAPMQLSSIASAKDNALTLQAVPSCSPSSRQLSNSGPGTQLGSPFLLPSEASKTSTTVSAISTTTSPSSNSAAQMTSTSNVTTFASSTSVLSAPLTTSTAEPGSSNKTGNDSNNVVSLKIIISDNQEESSAADKALSQAVSSISGDQIPTIYLSSPAKPPSMVPSTPKASLDEVAQAVSGLQRSESVIASPLVGTSQPQQSYIIQLPFDGAVSSPASFFLATDVQNRQTIVPALVSKGQAIAPNQFGVSPQRQGFPAGSTFILPSPMKPVVLPLSVMGQSSLGNMQMVSNQLVSLPNSTVVRPSEIVQPLPAGAVKQFSPSGPQKNATKKVPSSSFPGQDAQKSSAILSSGHRRILCFDSPGETQIGNANTSPSAPSSQPLAEPPPQTKPAILTGNKPKRRIEPVRCSNTDKSPQKSMNSRVNQKEVAKKGSRKQEHTVCDKEPSTSSSKSKTDSPKPKRRSKSTDGRQNHATDEGTITNAKESHHSRSLSSDSSQKSSSKKEKDTTEKGKSREGRAEKRAQETTSVTANKENELKGQEQQPAPSSAAPTHTTAQPKSSKALSKTSALAKQATEMLHDIQALNSPSSAKDQEESGSDCPKTPVRTRKGRDGEGTPKHLVPTNGPDIPTCSPASEAGSESSINMAAHTLMILSRAAMGRTGTPLKNSLRQKGAGQQSPTTAKNTKKRKQSTPTSSPPAKKEAKRTPSKKKERKKLMECFPQDLDVDKFLSSLHYDE